MTSRVLLVGGALCLLVCVAVAQVGVVEIIGATVRSHTDYGGPLSGAKKIFLMTSEKFEFQHRSVIFAIVAFFKNTNPVKFMVMRPTADSDKYQMVWQFHVTPQDSDLHRRTVINVTNNDCFMAQNRDRLAVLNVEEETSLAHEFFVANEEAALFYNLEDGIPQLNDIVTYGTLPLPYGLQFAVAADADVGWYGATVLCRPGLIVPGEPAEPTTPPTTPERGPKGDQGEKGQQGIRGPTGAKGDTGQPGADGNNGPQGQKGDLGDLGPTGPTGDKGNPGQDGQSLKGDRGAAGAVGPAGPPGPTGSKGERGNSGGNAQTLLGDGDCECGEGLLQKSVILGLIVWLLILTLLIIMLIVLLTVRRKEYYNTRESLRSMHNSAAWVHTTEPWAGKDPYVIDTMSR